MCCSCIYGLSSVPKLGDRIESAAKNCNIKHHRGGTYLAMEGPQFSTLAESHMYRSWGCDVIGMTNMPEAKLAREAEICYASIAMVTDYDSWHPDHGEVDINSIIATLKSNTENAQKLITDIAKSMSKIFEPCPTGCQNALDFAIMTQPNDRNPDLVKKLDAVAGRVL